MLAGTARDIASPLAYMVGAGVGEILLQLPPSDSGEQNSLITLAARLNSEVVVKPAPEEIAPLSLMLAIGAESGSGELVSRLRLVATGVPTIFCRANEPGRVAILPGAPPCLLCADADLLGPPKERGNNAGFIAMVATTEAFKLLAGLTAAAVPMLLEFTGFACVSRELRQRESGRSCGCGR